MERKYPYTDDNGLTWFDEDSYDDPIGGHHDSGLGWNPTGHFCGECCASTCCNCQYRELKENE